MDVSGAALQFGDCRDNELAGFLDRALTIKLPDISNETTDIGTVSSHVPMVCSNWVFHPRAPYDIILAKA